MLTPNIGYAKRSGTGPLSTPTGLRRETAEGFAQDSHPPSPAHARRADSFRRRSAWIIPAHSEGRGILGTGFS